MAEKVIIEEALRKKILDLKPEELERALENFRKKLTSESAACLNTCVRCGLCSDSCHYFLAYGDLKSHPSYKLNLVIDIFKRYFSAGGKMLPGWFGGADLDERMIEEWIDSLYGRCTLCGRCALNCTMGINIPYMIQLARGAMASLDLIPPGLASTISTAVEKGNNMGIPREDWIDTVTWLEEELRTEVNDPEASLPFDREGSYILYTVNPREPKFFPLSLLAAAKIFYAARESWTLSRDDYDVTNYAYYSGDDEAAAMISGRLIGRMQKLGARMLVLAECGHGFLSNRWEAPGWLKREQAYEVKSFLEVVADYIRNGRIKLDSSRNSKPVTLHDPCNLVRLGGVVEDQRYILKHAVTNFIEMIPNREKNYCCGGGGGQLAMTEYAERRIKAGKIKSEQIQKTGAKVVVTPCHNCIDQLMELNKHYSLGVEIKTVGEIVANAIVLEKK